jgi:iron complex transport system permease protein
MMKQVKTDRHVLFLILLILATFIMGICALATGRFSVKISEVVEILFSRLSDREPVSDRVVQNVVFLLRLPRIITAILVGGALALSGSTY